MLVDSLISNRSKLRSQVALVNGYGKLAGRNAVRNLGGIDLKIVNNIISPRSRSAVQGVPEIYHRGII